MLFYKIPLVYGKVIQNCGGTFYINFPGQLWNEIFPRICIYLGGYNCTKISEQYVKDHLISLVLYTTLVIYCYIHTGSGVLIRRYKAVRISMKDMILGTFFQPGFLSRYIPEVTLNHAMGVEFVKNGQNHDLFWNFKKYKK